MRALGYFQYVDLIFSFSNEPSMGNKIIYFRPESEQSLPST